MERTQPNNSFPRQFPTGNTYPKLPVEMATHPDPVTRLLGAITPQEEAPNN